MAISLLSMLSGQSGSIRPGRRPLLQCWNPPGCVRFSWAHASAAVRWAGGPARAFLGPYMDSELSNVCAQILQG